MIVENYCEQILFSEQIIKDLLDWFDGYGVKRW
ncbi:MAG: hypothetical protein AEth_01357 [Candidatus Argoarchaeum ethanivorans]|uniref:Uncharacterized protein n=1 Tax=Candidatus Argoarchaeum ethanivorans TaxID=2608793 RepID=A0A8B3S157_9EURY|nr:MAG: hypothetical protein AEth_01357 [Candidatus Argoarchaeum ethanivorans]